MEPKDREIIRSELHQIDLLLRSIEQKSKFFIEMSAVVHARIAAIEGHKKKIYEVLDKKEKKNEKRPDLMEEIP